KVRFKLFDYGVISVALTRTLPGAWSDVVDTSIALQDDTRLLSKCESLCRDLITRFKPAMTVPREALLAEDYIVFSIPSHEGRPTAERLVEEHGDDIVRTLRGERESLSRQEREEVLRHRISY